MTLWWPSDVRRKVTNDRRNWSHLSLKNLQSIPKATGVFPTSITSFK